MLPPSPADAALLDQIQAVLESIPGHVQAVPAHLRALPQTIPQFLFRLITGPPSDFFIWVLLPVLLFTAFLGQSKELKRKEMDDKAQAGKVKEATESAHGASAQPAGGGGGVFVSDKGADGKGSSRGNQPVKKGEEAKVRKQRM